MAKVKHFNSDGYVAEFRELFYKRLEEFADKLAREMVNSMNGGTDAEAFFKSEVIHYVRKSITRTGSKFNALVGVIDAPEHIYFKAFIMAYGSGIYMNTKDNPWFSDYQNGEYSGTKYWNVMRRATEITYRPLGETYYDFYNDTFSSGRGAIKDGSYPALDNLKMFHGDAWYNNAIEKMGLNNEQYIRDKIAEIGLACFNQVVVANFFK